MKRILIIITLILTASLAVQAKHLKLTYGPWITNMSETSFDVLFYTQEPALVWVEVAADDGNTWYKTTHTRYYQTIAGRRAMGKLHDIKVTGLTPGTSYRYRIYGRILKDASDPYAIQFGPEMDFRFSKKECVVKTFDKQADTVRFSMVNDMHFRAKRYKALMSGMDRNSDFILLNGDIISYAGSVDTVMKYTFMPISEQAMECPIVYSRGNHEGRGEDWDKVPALFPSPTGEFYYTFRQGPVAFVVLDAGEDKPDRSVEYSGTAQYDEYRAKELEWLRHAVKEEDFASAPHKVCAIHVPTINNKQAWYSQQWIAENLMPVLNEAGIKLMLSGHHHKYLFYEKGTFGNDYVIVVNDDKSRLDCVATNDSLMIRIFDEKGNETHSLKIND